MSIAARRPNDLAFSISIPPVSHHYAYPSSAVSPTTRSPTSPWKHSNSQSPFGDFQLSYPSNGYRPSRPAMPSRITSAPSLPRHAKLHKRNDSASSISLVPQVFTMPSPIQDEFTLGQQPGRRPSANKIKPYLRKMSIRDDDLDQGRLDLSRPSAENESLAGLGICETTHVYARSVSDVSFQPASHRRASHSRATSGPASLAAAAPGPLRPTQPFVHPMRQMPRSFTPPAGLSYDLDSPVDEAEESVGVLTNDPRLSDYDLWKPRRSVSISSGPASTPLSQTYTAGSLTKLTSASQSNLSLRSQQSCDQLKSGRPRKNTGRSTETPTSPSGRTSIDKAFSFLSRTSVDHDEPVSRAAAIRAARKAFEEKEAAKELKYEQEEIKRKESVLKKEQRQRRKSEAPNRLSAASNASNNNSIDEKVVGAEYESHFPAHDLSLPIQGKESIAAPTSSSAPQPSKTKVAKGGWNRVLAWTRTRLLNCGGKDSTN